jgi:hypothetical protein
VCAVEGSPVDDDRWILFTERPLIDHLFRERVLFSSNVVNLELFVTKKVRFLFTHVNHDLVGQQKVLLSLLFSSNVVNLVVNLELFVTKKVR